MLEWPSFLAHSLCRRGESVNGAVICLAKRLKRVLETSAPRVSSAALANQDKVFQDKMSCK